MMMVLTLMIRIITWRLDLLGIECFKQTLDDYGVVFWTVLLGFGVKSNL